MIVETQHSPSRLDTENRPPRQAGDGLSTNTNVESPTFPARASHDRIDAPNAITVQAHASETIAVVGNTEETGQLPVGWEKHFSNREMRHYYFNSLTGESRWVKPT
jgi:hypothetical protein